MAFSGRESMANRIRPIVVSEADRRELERLQRSPSAAAGLSRRARTVLLMAQGLAGVEIAERTGYTVVQVSRLRRRFAEQGVAGLQDRPRSGRPPTITARKRAQNVALTASVSIVRGRALSSLPSRPPLGVVVLSRRTRLSRK